MSASSGVVSFLGAVASSAGARKTQDLIAKVSLYWTAWSVLASFRTVQDFLDFLERAAAEISNNLAWLVRLIVFMLEAVAGYFHTLADIVFGWVPLLNLVPDELREPIIVVGLAVIPTAIAMVRFGRLGRAFREIHLLCEAWLSSPDRSETTIDLDDDIAANGRCIDEKASDWFRRNRVHFSGWRHVMRSSEAAASRVAGLLGFRVFSARFFIALLLASALSWEIYSQSLFGGRAWQVLLSLWAFMGGAFLMGWAISLASRRAVEKDLPQATLQLAIIHSINYVGQVTLSGDEESRKPQYEGRSIPNGILVGLLETASVRKLIDRVLVDDATLSREASAIFEKLPASVIQKPNVVCVELFDALSLRQQASMLLKAWRGLRELPLAELDPSKAAILPVHATRPTLTKPVEQRLAEFVPRVHDAQRALVAKVLDGGG